MRSTITLLFTLLFMSCATAAKDLRTASYVDIERYVGKWYSIEALPQFFTRNCEAQTAEYKIIDEKTISVVNTCLNGKDSRSISGKAVVDNEVTNAELTVTFDNFWTRLFRVKGDYTIIKLDPNYDYVLVGSKDRKSLWILARSTSVPEAIIEEYKAVAQEEGFPVSKMIPSKF